MLRSLTIKNFQSHKLTNLDFSPRVNVIIGKSRAGKTSLLRAIRKILENRPITGIERWVHGQDPKGTISIALETTDNHNVIWEGPNPQRYIVDGEALTGFGQSVPSRVSEILNLGEINIQSQHDRPYLLFDSPGEVARTLNRVVNLDVIDTALSNAAALQRQNTQDMRTREVRLGELRELEAGFPDLESAEEFIADLEQQKQEIIEKRAKTVALRSIQSRLTVLRAGLVQWKLPDGIDDAINVLFTCQAELERKHYTLITLQRIQQNLSGLRAQAKTLAPAMEQKDKVAALIAKQGQLQAKNKQLTRLRGLNTSILKERQNLLQKSAIIKKEELEYGLLWPNKCPLCGK